MKKCRQSFSSPGEFLTTLSAHRTFRRSLNNHARSRWNDLRLGANFLVPPTQATSMHLAQPACKRERPVLESPNTTEWNLWGM